MINVARMENVPVLPLIAPHRDNVQHPQENIVEDHIMTTPEAKSDAGEYCRSLVPLIDTSWDDKLDTQVTYTDLIASCIYI